MTTPASIKTFLSPDYSVAGFEAAWGKSPDSIEEEIILLFSPFSEKYILVKYSFDRPVLHLLDRNGHYFMNKAGLLLELLISVLKKHAFKRVILIGSSKGATGVLLFGSLLATAMKDIRFDGYAFSPQTRIWPYNADLRLPSYEALINHSKEDSALKSDLECYGNLPSLPHPGNFHVLITFGEKNPRDQLEARSFEPFPGVTLNPLPIQSHTTIVPYVINCSDRKALEEALLTTVTRNPNEKDIKELKRHNKLMMEVERYHTLRGCNLCLKDLIADPLGKR